MHPEAQAEMFAAAERYDEEAPGVGDAFLNEAALLFERIQSAPGRYALHSFGVGVRRLVGSRFPYTVFYLECDGGVFILAVAHQRRRPNYWRGRV